MTIELRRNGAPVAVPSGRAGALLRAQRALRERRETREVVEDAAFLTVCEREARLELRQRFRAACERLGLGTGDGHGLPLVVDVAEPLADCPRLVLEMPPGLQMAALVEVAGGLAEALDVRRVTFALRGGHRVEARLLGVDPLLSSAPLSAPELGRVVFGRVEDGTLLSLRPAEQPHTVVQGATGSGKSVWTYGYLAQVAACPDVQVRMSDPTGVLVRPWPASPDLVGGLADPAAHVAMLTRLVAEMDARMALIPEDADQITPGPDVPLIVVVLEEYAGLVRVGDKAHRETVQGLVARLLAEARKVAIRVLMLIQRADASLIGGFERSNMPLRISFRVDNKSAIEMLHPDPGPDVVAAHSFALPGVALVSAPGVPLRRMRAPFVEYPEYARRVRGASQ